MHLTEKENLVVTYLENQLDEENPSIAYSEIESDLSLDSKQLRGVVSSLIKKKKITHDYEKDAQMSFIGLR